MQMVGPWGRYLPQWLRAPGNGSGPAICQHTHTHTHTHWTLPTTMSVLETPFDIHVSSVYQTHTCMQAPILTLCISAKKTHNKGSRTQPIMSTLMPRSGIPVICSRATLSCDSSYYFPFFSDKSLWQEYIYYWPLIPLYQQTLKVSLIRLSMCVYPLSSQTKKKKEGIKTYNFD